MIRIGTYGFHFASFMNTIFNELHQRQVKYDVHKTSIIKSIHATSYHILFLLLIYLRFNCIYFVMRSNTIRWA